MKKFHELVDKYVGMTGTKYMTQWCVSIELDAYLFNKRIESIKQKQNEKL
tara:strand:+ start:288 stop:437 length:150 start_codon:yes stop_codon:yes gene_type:complete